MNTVAKAKAESLFDLAVGETLIRKRDGKGVSYCYLCKRAKRARSLPILTGTGPGLEHIATYGIDKDGSMK